MVRLTLFLTVLIASYAATAQEALFPIVKGHGGIYEIPEAVEYPPNDKKYKIVVDIKIGSEGVKSVNPGLNNLARLLNLHGLGGVSKENLEVVAVVHNEATVSVVSHKAYENRFGTKNPNIDLLTSLHEAGVTLFICGQSLRARKVDPDELAEEVAISLSALTVLTKYQLDGYALISF